MHPDASSAIIVQLEQHQQITQRCTGIAMGVERAHSPPLAGFAAVKMDQEDARADFQRAKTDSISDCTKRNLNTKLHTQKMGNPSKYNRETINFVKRHRSTVDRGWIREQLPAQHAWAADGSFLLHHANHRRQQLPKQYLLREWETTRDDDW